MHENVTSLSIHLVEQNYSIAENTRFVFSDLTEFRLAPLSNGSTVEIHCENDLSFSYAGIQKLAIEGIAFYRCGQVHPVISLLGGSNVHSKEAIFNNVAFIETRRQNSVTISRNIYYVEVVNCSFRDGLGENNFYLNSPITTSLFRHTVFASNGAYSVQTSVTGISANFSHCTFINNRGKSIQIDTANTTIDNSLFSSNFQTPVTIRYKGRNVIISRSIFVNNSAMEAGVMDVKCQCELTVLHSIFTDNQAMQRGGVALLRLPVASFFNCTFLNNTALEGIGGALYYGRLKITSFQVINCTFERNTALLGGAFYVKWSVDTIIHQCHFRENTATAYDGAVSITSYDGGNLTMTSCSFQGNTANYNGALTIEKGHTVVIHDCNFSKNTALFHAGALYLKNSRVSERVSHPVISSCIFSSNSADEGGAIKIKDIWSPLFLNCTFSNNTARFGGALQANSGSVSALVNTGMLSIRGSLFMQNRAYDAGGAITTDGYNVYINMSTFMLNQAEKLGGAIRMNYSKRNTELVSFVVSELVIEKSSFKSNSASCAGAVALDHLKVKLVLSGVKFVENRATQEGGAARFYILTSTNHLTIESCDFLDNEVYNETGRGGALASYNEQLNIFSSNFHGNRAQYGGAIFSQNTSLIAIQGSSFSSNQAAQGGGVYSNTTNVEICNSTFQHNVATNYGGSITLTQAKLYFRGHSKFTNNTVQATSGRGGAIFVRDRRENCSVNSCLISWTNYTRVNFFNNIANQGPMIYGGMLNRCYRTPESQPAQVLYSEGLPYKHNTYRISSDSVQFCFCNTTTPHCSHSRHVAKTLFPGQTLKVYATCVDQMQQMVSCFVRSEYKNSAFQLGQGQSVQHLEQCQPLNFTSYTNTENFSTLTISGDIVCDQSQWNTLEVNITVIKCPKGFEKITDRCTCDNRIGKNFPSAVCDIDNGQVQLNQLGWIGYDEHYLRILDICPLNYCSVKKLGIYPSKPDTQCSNNHGGVLCGGCLANHSVILGSWKCMDCSLSAKYNFIWLTPLLALAGLVLVVFLLLVKMTVSSGTINGLIFYANVLSLSGLLDYPACPVQPVLRVFVSWINLDIGIETCFYSGMDVYQKTWLQFVFPFYVWAIICGIIVLCQFSSKVMHAMGVRNIEVLATLFLMSYTKLLKAIVTALSFTDLQIANASNTSDRLIPERVWVYDGKISFLGKQHLPLFTVALLILILLFFPYTLFLMFGQCIRSIQRRRILKWTRSKYFVYIIDSYHAPYINRHRYWTGLCLLVRCILFTIFATRYSIDSNLLWISLAVAFLLVLKVCISRSVYKSKMVDLLELSYLVNLGVLALLLQYNNESCSAIAASISLALVTFVIMLVGHSHLEMYKNIRLYAAFSQKVQQVFHRQRPQQDQQEPDSIPIPYPEKHPTSYVNLRESLLSI